MVITIDERDVEIPDYLGNFKLERYSPIKGKTIGKYIDFKIHDDWSGFVYIDDQYKFKDAHILLRSLELGSNHFYTVKCEHVIATLTERGLMWSLK